MVAATEHVFVLREQLRHYLAFPATLTAITGILVQVDPAICSGFHMGLFRRLHGGPDVLLLQEWNFSTNEPAGNSTGSVKGFTH